MVYGPPAVPAGKTYVALAAPAATFAITGVPIGVMPLRIVKVSVPSLTVPAELLTVALSGTFCAALLKGTEALGAVVVVVAGVTVRWCVLSELPPKFGVLLYAAWMV